VPEARAGIRLGCFLDAALGWRRHTVSILDYAVRWSGHWRDFDEFGVGFVLVNQHPLHCQIGRVNLQYKAGADHGAIFMRHLASDRIQIGFVKGKSLDARQIGRELGVRSMSALSRKWWKAYWQLTKSKLPEATGNAALSPCTQAMSGILCRARRNFPSEPSRPTDLAFGVRPRLAICWLPVPHAMSNSVIVAVGPRPAKNSMSSGSADFSRCDVLS
jgi:hypothetical protein